MSDKKVESGKRSYSPSSVKGHGRKLVANIDGAARGNPGHAGIGAVIWEENGRLLLNISEYIGKTTNNIAEYSALIFSLQAISKFDASELRICSDSELLVNQLNGTYKVTKQRG